MIQYIKYLIYSFYTLLPIVNKLKYAGINTAPIVIINEDNGNINDNKIKAALNTMTN